MHLPAQVIELLDEQLARVVGRVVLPVACVAAVLVHFGQIRVASEVSGERGFVLAGGEVAAWRNMGEEEVRREGCGGGNINIGLRKSWAFSGMTK